MHLIAINVEPRGKCVMCVLSEHVFCALLRKLVSKVEKIRGKKKKTFDFFFILFRERLELSKVSAYIYAKKEKKSSQHTILLPQHKPI